MSSNQNFLLRCAPDCTFSSRKNAKAPYRGRRDTPYPRSIATLSRAWSLRSLAKIAPPNVFAHYATVRNVFKFHAYSVNIRLFLTTAKLVRRSNS